MDIYKNKFTIIKEQLDEEVDKYNTLCKHRSPILHEKLIKAQKLNMQYIQKFTEFETFLDKDNIEELTNKAEYLSSLGQKQDDFLESLNIDELLKKTEWVKANSEDTHEGFGSGVAPGTNFVESLNDLEPVFFRVIDKIEKLEEKYGREESKDGIEGFGMLDGIKNFFVKFFKVIIDVFKFIYKFIMFWVNLLKKLVIFTAWFARVVIVNFVRVPLVTTILAFIILILSDLIYRKLTGQLVVFIPPIVITVGLTLFLLVNEFELLQDLQLYLILLILSFFKSSFVKYILNINNCTPFLIEFNKSKNEKDKATKRKYITKGIGLLLLHLVKNLLRFLLLLIIVGFALKTCVFDVFAGIGTELTKKVLGKSM